MDYQTLWILLKEYVNTKNSHGKNELKAKMEEIELKQLKTMMEGK